jgi:hypothetical protein
MEERTEPTEPLELTDAERGARLIASNRAAAVVAMIQSPDIAVHERGLTLRKRLIHAYGVQPGELPEEAAAELELLCAKVEIPGRPPIPAVRV